MSNILQPKLCQPNGMEPLETLVSHREVVSPEATAKHVSTR
jgi:hypothetical protein